MKTLLDSTREKLRPFMGKSFILPDNTERKFISFDISASEDVTISTDKGPIRKQASEVILYLERLRTIDGEQALPALVALEQAQQQVGQMVPLGELSDILMDSIRKVKADATFIDQARAINEQAKTVVDIMKVRVEALKVIKDYQKP